MKTNNLTWESYAAPTVEVTEFAVEAGFATSGVLNSASNGEYGENANGDY